MLIGELIHTGTKGNNKNEIGTQYGCLSVEIRGYAYAHRIYKVMHLCLRKCSEYKFERRIVLSVRLGKIAHTDYQLINNRFERL